MSSSGSINVAVVGGGLVGALNACYFAKRGFKVDLYEYRDDIRLMQHVTGKSINLALSHRGLSALQCVGIEKDIVDHGIPMYARMIHGTDGSKRPVYYGKKDQFIMSVSRRHLNELLLNAAEKNPNVTIHFGHKLLTADLSELTAIFRKESTKEEVTVKSDFLVGCDGAFSVVRREMVKQPGYNFSQTYIEHGYMELCIPPNEDGEFAMEKNYLHIWPRGKFMLIALPNQDKSWTVTLFMPVKNFYSITTKEELILFFNKNFRDAMNLIGLKRLTDDFFSLTPSLLVSIKCNPYHVGKSAVIMGDAAHAMVPFYGQGMNAGFEDCFILNELLEKHGNDLLLTLSEFSLLRNPDAEAICDLALYNYIEMRDLVNTRGFLIRKKLDGLLHFLFPCSWIPLYTMVTFTSMRYSEVVKRKQTQDKILKFAGIGCGILTLFAIRVAYDLIGRKSITLKFSDDFIKGYRW